MHLADWQLKSEWRERMKLIRGAVKEGRQALEERRRPGASSSDDGGIDMR